MSNPQTLTHRELETLVATARTLAHPIELLRNAKMLDALSVLVPESAHRSLCPAFFVAVRNDFALYLVNEERYTVGTAYEVATRTSDADLIDMMNRLGEGGWLGSVLEFEHDEHKDALTGRDLVDLGDDDDDPLYTPHVPEMRAA